MVASQRRVIDVFVRDRRGRPIPGASIAFLLNGVPAGGVPNSEGRGRIELEDRTGVVTVSAAYDDLNQEELLSQDQDNFTFTFDVDIAPEGFVERLNP